MSLIAIVFHSTRGRTGRVAESIRQGALSLGGDCRLVEIDQQGEVSTEAWSILRAASTIVFGAPTSMGSVSWQFKKFADASSKVWAVEGWEGKVAAGFTSSSTLGFGKTSTLSYLSFLAAQHKMLWMGTGFRPTSSDDAPRDRFDHMGGHLGLELVTPPDAAVDDIREGHLRVAEAVGENIARVTRILSRC